MLSKLGKTWAIIFVRVTEINEVLEMVDSGDIKKKGKEMADKTKEGAHKAEHRAEEAGEKAKDTVKRQL